MKHLLLSAVAGLALMPTISTAATFEFNLTDWSDGGVFSGSFEAEDLDGDGQISQFSGEVTGFSATYQSGQFNGPISFDDSAFGGDALTGLVYNLDGLGTIGDSTFGDIEGLGVTSSDGNFYLAVGPGPVGLCDGQQDCGVLQDLNGLVFVDDDVIIDDNDGPFFGTILATNDQSIQVTAGPLC